MEDSSVEIVQVRSIASSRPALAFADRAGKVHEVEHPRTSRLSSGPRWIGIGAQRSGTTWFTDLLCSHPQVVLAANGRKEQHAFNRSLVTGWSAADQEDYRNRFSQDPSLRPGEFTPFYLRGLWIPPLLHQTAPDAIILALLRDPVQRFESAMRLHLSQRSFPGTDAIDAALNRWVRLHGADQQWAGMYATQLREWRRHLGADQLMVMQYEQVLANPHEYVSRVWAALDLPGMQLPVWVDTPSATASSDRAFTLSPELATTLARVYRDEVDELKEWGIDPSLWPTFRRAGSNPG